MDKIEKIKEWVKKQKKEELARNSIGVITGKALFVDAKDLLSFLDTLEAEERPEPYTGKYDEAYIQEKIEEATKSWEGVDVDKYMDEVRGRGEKDTPELDGEAEEWAENEAYGKSDAEFEMAYKGFIAGAEWQKQQMLKDAKDGYVSAIIIHNDGDEEHYAVTYPNGERRHSITDKVKIIIL